MPGAVDDENDCSFIRRDAQADIPPDECEGIARSLS